MQKNTKIIFIIVFLVVGIIMLGFYFYFGKNTNTNNTTVGDIYQKFNPFGGSKTTTTPTGTENPTENPTTNPEVKINSRFHKITNFAVSGAVYFEEIRPLPKKETVAETPVVEPILKTTTKD